MPLADEIQRLKTHFLSKRGGILNGKLGLEGMTAPGTPDAGTGVIYADTSGRILSKTPDGSVGALSYNKRHPNAPVDPYVPDKYAFGTNDFVNHIADFNDSQATPYSFGGSPGGFSISPPASGYGCQSGSYRHHLWMYDGNAPGDWWLQWTDATGKTASQIWLSCTKFPNASSEVLLGGIRFWGVQSPGGSDAYGELRFRRGTVSGFDVGMYYGTGTTLAVGDGTQWARWEPMPTGTLFYISTYFSAAPAMFTDWYNAHTGYPALGGSWGSSVPATIKTCRIYLKASTWWGMLIDRIRFYNV